MGSKGGTKRGTIFDLYNLYFRSLSRRACYQIKLLPAKQSLAIEFLLLRAILLNRQFDQHTYLAILSVAYAFYLPGLGSP